jgi:hypothetical protein
MITSTEYAVNTDYDWEAGYSKSVQKLFDSILHFLTKT